MAATSGGGVDWGSVQKILITASNTTFKSSDVPRLVDAIHESKSEILKHDDKFENFYSCFVALSAHYIADHSSLLSKSVVGSVVSACHVLMDFCLQRMLKFKEACSVSQRNLMSLIEGLCTGVGQLQRSNVVTLTAMLKTAKMPVSTKQVAEETALIKVKETQSISRADFVKQLMSAFKDTSTAASGSCGLSKTSINNEPETLKSMEKDGSRSYFASRNIDNLHALRGADILLDVCLNLPFLQRYINNYKEATTGQGFVLPNTYNDANSIKANFPSLLNDMTIVNRVLNLPTLEPMTASHLEKVATVIMSCLYAAIAAAVASTIMSAGGSHVRTGSESRVGSITTMKEEELESICNSVVLKGLSLFDKLICNIKTSTRASGHHLQNLYLMGAWCALGGMDHILTLTAASSAIPVPPEKGKEKEEKGPAPATPFSPPRGPGEGASGKPPPSGATAAPKTTKADGKDSGPPPAGVPPTAPRPTSAKGTQGFSSLTVALSTFVLKALTQLLEDLHIERLSQESSIVKVAQAKLEILPPFSATQRVKTILEAYPLTSLLLNLFTGSYKKACALIRLKSEMEDAADDESDSHSLNECFVGETGSYEESSEDDDSEPILGPWFEESLTSEPESKDSTPTAPPPPPPPSDDKKDGEKQDSNKALLTGDLTDKEEATEYLKLSRDVLQFLTGHLFQMSEDLCQLFPSLAIQEQHTASLANVLKDLDKSTIKMENSHLSDEFSSVLIHFCHTLLSSDLLSPKLQDVLLGHLGVQPSSCSSWPLSLPPRTLAILAHILVKRQQTWTGSSEQEHGMTVGLRVWQKFLSVLREWALKTDTQPEGEDVNVEHIQLLLFVFDSLARNSKMIILTQCANIIVEASQSRDVKTKNPLAVCRLLLIFEYFLHHYSQPPPQLYDQVQWNIFTVQSSDPALMLYQEERGGIAVTKFYTPCREVEENYRKVTMGDNHFATMDGSTFKRSFYNLISAETDRNGPGIDKGACEVLYDPNFDYNELYSAVIELIGAGSDCHLQASQNTTPFDHQDGCAIHYTATVCWRLLGRMAPSVAYIKLLEGQHCDSERPLTQHEVLHSLRWVPRMPSSKYKTWIKEHLCEQRLPDTEAESLLDIVIKQCHTVKFDVQMAQESIARQLSQMPLDARLTDILPAATLPSLHLLYTIDAVIGKLRISLQDRFMKAMDEDDPRKGMEVAQDLQPIISQLVEMFGLYSRSCLLGQLDKNSDMKPEQLTRTALSAYGAVLRIASSRASPASAHGLTMLVALPGPVRTAVEKWNGISMGDYPSIPSLGDNVTTEESNLSENYLNSLRTAHLGLFSNQTNFTIAAAVQHVMASLVRFTSDLSDWCPESKSNKDRMVNVLFPLLLDASTESVAESATSVVGQILGPQDSEEFSSRLFFQVFRTYHDIFTKHAQDSVLDDCIYQECVQAMESHLEKEAAKQALEKLYTERADLIDVLLSSANENLSVDYGTKVLKFFNKLMQIAEEHPSDTYIDTLCSSLGRQGSSNPLALQRWLSRIIRDSDPGGKGQENRVLLQSLTSYIVKENSAVGEGVASALLRALIPMCTQLLSNIGSESFGIAELMPVMITLAGAGSGMGHVELFCAAGEWLASCKSYLSHKDVAEKIGEDVTEGKHHTVMEAACYLLSYVANVLGALKQSGDKSALPSFDMDSAMLDVDSDWAEDIAMEEDDSGGEDSDEDSLCNKLCTFTITQKEFMNQHWYHCHTCKMVDGVGVCTICAKVCHKGHELSYAKYGSFFCDCGAKEDGSCQTLVKRTPGSNLESSMSNTSVTSPFSSNAQHSSSQAPSSGSSKTSTLRHRVGGGSSSTTVPSSVVGSVLSSPGNRIQGGSGGGSGGSGESGSGKPSEELIKFRQMLGRQLEKNRDAILKLLEQNGMATHVIELLQSLTEPIEAHCNRTSAVGATARAQKALSDLHTRDKSTESTDQLMVPTLGSQEGAFENVRANFSGDQGQTIRQLLGAHMLRRVAMCCLASPHGRRQHLAVCHEKGRITLLQLSALLKQADSSKRKLTLTRLSSAPVPFTVLSITGNPCNEDYLAVCGLKDCHVLTFTSSGSVADHLVLHPQLEAGNFIIKAVWLPGSQTQLAIVTADFVKIYNLSKDALSPTFYFLVPSGKIRDACFVFDSEEHSRTLVLMSSAGYLYTQPMEEASEAKHGPFYVTNVLEVKHDDLKDSGGQIAGGGVSCYYSHTLQLLFFSFAQGKSFCAPIKSQHLTIDKLFPITIKSNGSGKSNNPPPLCQWSEVPMHPGLVCCLTQTNSIPVVMMVEPDRIRVQEIKTLPAKAKVQDMVAIRHTSSTDQHRTTLILLCEDGSLRIYMANVDSTGFWMSPQFQASSSISTLKPVRKKKATKSGRPSGQVSFPVDFFEHCQAMNDVEYGGNDLLQIYNVQQVKHRLNTTGTYVASTKFGGFSIEVMNNNNSMVMLGVRVHVGTQAIEKAPSYLEVFGRTNQVTLTRNRWFDMPFTRDESLTADKKFTLFVGPSSDPSGVTMVDSIKVYGKTKEAFGWPDDPPDDFTTSTSNTATSAAGVTSNTNSSSSGAIGAVTNGSSGAVSGGGSTTSVTASQISVAHAGESEVIVPPPIPLTSLDRLVASSLEVLEGFVSLVQMDDREPTKQTIRDLATEMLILPTPTSVQQFTKTLLATVQPSNVAYHNHKDQAQLSHVVQCLGSAFSCATTTPSTSMMATAAPPCSTDAVPGGYDTTTKPNELDPEAYQRLVVTARSVAVSRPQNLVRFAAGASPTTEARLLPVRNIGDLEVTDIEIEDKLHASSSSSSTSISSSSSSTPTSTTTTSTASSDLTNDQPLPFVSKKLVMTDAESKHFLTKLLDAFWRLHDGRPANPMLAPACLPGLTHIEITIGALVDVIHAFAYTDSSNVALATKLLMKMLVCEDVQVSFAAKQALIRVMRPRQKRRRVIIPSPPQCSSPPVPDEGAELNEDVEEEEDDEGDMDRGVMQGVEEEDEEEEEEEEDDEEREMGLHQDGDDVEGLQDEASYEVVEHSEPMVLEPGDAAGLGGGANNQLPLEALLGGRGGFAPMLEIPPEADDEAMMELAIALSLQEQSNQGGGGINLQGLGLGVGGAQGQSSSSLEEGPLSDTTASAASDDEGSTAATDGSTLRTSPAEQGGSAGSESGASAVDSITGDHSVSGRSSAYGDMTHEHASTQGESVSSGGGMVGQSTGREEGGDLTENLTETYGGHRMHTLRLLLLERLLEYLPDLRMVGGVRAIPFMQVILMLSSDLDPEDEKDKGALDRLLTIVLFELQLDRKTFGDVSARTPHHEVQLIVMRLLSVFMSRTKSGTKQASESSTQISHATAAALLSCGAVDHCLLILKALLDHWKETDIDDEPSPPGGNLLKPHPPSAPPDMSPFFLRQYVKGHAGDVFEAYPQLLTEMVLRLPYQMKKICDSAPSVGIPIFDQAWFYYLCEYMMTQQTPFVRRQVRKLLLFICGSKEKYRQLRDLHVLESCMRDIKQICSENGLHLETTSTTPISLPYDTLITLIEHLKACQEVATSRTTNWQRFAIKDETVIPSLLQASFHLDEGVSPLVLQLLTCALCGVKGQPTSSSSSSSSSSSRSKRERERQKEKEKEKDKDKDKSEEKESSPAHDEALCQALVNQLNKSISRDILRRFIRTHLLESNNTALRWQAHGFLLYIFRSSPPAKQEELLELMWELWPELSNYGRKASQFVDLLGYFSLKAPYSVGKSLQYVQKAATLLKTQNQCLANHPNSNIYNMLAGLVEFDGFYLESDPCLVCNNPEVPFTNMKLTALKVDSRNTANSQIVKLVGTHTIAKVTLRISDLKRTKMVRTINIYYNNRTVQSVVELKNKPTIWHKAKKCVLAAGQTELKLEFPLPIVAANIMIEYADFYDNLTASAETLQCPRCSASVPANPGVCGNCGENVFQCHKCRAINYDEKDPFLCNSCGFCKYAKFDYTLTARACCAVDPIENEEDRKKATTSINSLLERADRVYRQLVSHRPQLEALLVKVHEAGGEKSSDLSSVASSGPSGSSGVATVNRVIQLLAQRYCGDCKGTFEELSKIIQKVLACRKELVEYDCRQRESSLKAGGPHSGMTPLMSPLPSPHPTPTASSVAVEVASCQQERSLGRCYGCAAAATEHCVTLLRALASHPETRQILVNQGLIQELVGYNMRRGSAVIRTEVRQLLFLLTRDNAPATQLLNDILMARIGTALQGHRSNPDLAGAVRNEMALLIHTIEKDDSCWEKRLKCVMKLFLMAVKTSNPVVMENITLPCLRILHHLVKPPQPTSKKNKEKTVENLSTIKPAGSDIYINTTQWMGEGTVGYTQWKTKVPSNKSAGSPETSEKKLPSQEARGRYLMEKYGRRWMANTKKSPDSLSLGGTTWLCKVLFSSSSRAARQVASNIVESVCQVSSRRQQMLDLLTSYLDQVGPSGESAQEFLALYQRLIKADHWKLYLAAKGLLPHLAGLIAKEIDVLSTLEETTLTSDLSQGYALKMLTDLLASFLDVSTIRRHYKSKLLGPVLHGYLALRKLVVQRTKLVDETQQTLLELLEEMTSGTEIETRAFMEVCVDTVKRYGLEDLRTPVFIFERLCSIIYPEENEIGEFFVTLEKDPQQEDFLQGRMQGNPYSSNEPDLGPLMRDVKNKICRDCELIALLEDDTGMELLVNNKIMSLDLPVKDVYKKIWCPENEGEPMRITYRMRGLLGDATEEFIESVDNTNDEDTNDEDVYKLASVMSECDGLAVMLHRLAYLNDLVRGQQLLIVLLKLFNYSSKVKANRQRLIEPGMQTLNIMLAVLNRVLLAEHEEPGSGGGAMVAEQLLSIMEVILMEANNEPLEGGKPSVILSCDKSQLVALLDRINSPFVRSHASVLQGLMRIIPFLSFGEGDKMRTLINHFKPYLDFDKFDGDHSQDDEIHVESFCVITAGIENNVNGVQLKDMMIEEGIVKDAIKYVSRKVPLASNLDSLPWKEFLSKPALPYVLRILTGLCTGHAKSQLLAGNEIIPAIHKMEQISSEEGIGSLSENLMEALKSNPTVAKKIDEVRTNTKAEKKRLAMAMRMKQLGALGMSTNDKGQVTAKKTVFKQMEELMEETGLTCCICREGYRYQPEKVLGIYTFTKCSPLEEFEIKSRKTQGYTTVSHFNIVHYDCHVAAVRHARGREEWESAALQNANTKCNGLLPLWGPSVPESAFASCLARHNSYLQECTGHREPAHHATIHDLKLLLQRFGFERSFSDDSGGGGRQSNVHLIPYLMHMALYVINTTRSVPREEKNLNALLKSLPSKWVEASYEVDGPFYYAVLHVHLMPPEKWKENRLVILKQLLVAAQTRHVSPSGATMLSDKQVKDYKVYKGTLVFFGLVERLYSLLLKDMTHTTGNTWPVNLASYIRNNDEILLKAGDKLLLMYEEDLLPCESFAEFCDVDGLLGDIPNPDQFLADTLKSIP